MILVKLGGSVITDKSKLRTFKRSSCERLAEELRTAKGGLALVHGAGSFGHILAKKHKLHKGYVSRSQLEHVAGVQRDVRELNLKVIEALIGSGIHGVSIPPAASATFEGGKVKSFDPCNFVSMLELGLVPVTFGDVVPDESMGFSICSGDLMMEELAEALNPRMVIFVADVDGVFDSDPKVNRNARLMPEINPRMLREVKRTETLRADVTGSIFGKLERMLAIAEHCEKCMIVNGNAPGRLEKAIRGKKVVSTVVLPG
jgi:isopentenyl phosphate kinase